MVRFLERFVYFIVLILIALVSFFSSSVGIFGFFFVIRRRVRFRVLFSRSVSFIVLFARVLNGLSFLFSIMSNMWCFSGTDFGI